MLPGADQTQTPPKGARTNKHYRRSPADKQQQRKQQQHFRRTVFVRQGVLLQVVRSRSRLSSFAARGSSAPRHSGAIGADQTGGVAAAVAFAAASQQAAHHQLCGSGVFAALSSDSAAFGLGADGHAHAPTHSRSGSAASVPATVTAAPEPSGCAAAWPAQMQTPSQTQTQIHTHNAAAPPSHDPAAALAFGAPTKELVRQCFLFTNHLLLCTRTKDGKLRLLDVSIILATRVAARPHPCPRPHPAPHPRPRPHPAPHHHPHPHPLTSYLLARGASLRRARRGRKRLRWLRALPSFVAAARARSHRSI